MQLTSEFKRVAKDSLIYGVSSVISRMVSLITAPVLTRIFRPDEYGIIALVQLAVGLFITIAGLNISSGVSYYFFHHEDMKTKRDTLVTGVFSVTVTAGLIALIFFLLTDQITDILSWKSVLINHDKLLYQNLPKYLIISSLTLFLGLLQTSFQSILRLLNRPKAYVLVDILSLAVNLICVFVFIVYMKVGVFGVFYSGVISGIVGSVIAFFLIKDYLVGGVFSLALLGPIIAYALPQMPGVLVNWLQTQLGRALMNYHVGLAELGLYSIGFSLASAIVMVTTAFRLAYDPYSLSIMKNEGAPAIYAKFYSLYSILFLSLASLFSLFAKPIIMILTPPEYHVAYQYVPVLVIAFFYMGANNIVATGIWISLKTFYTSIAQFISFSALISVSLLLIPRFGAYGAAVGFLAGAMTQSFAYYFFSQKLFYIPYQFIRTQIITIITLGSIVALAVYVEPFDLLHSMIVGSVGFIPLLAIIIFGLTNQAQRNRVVIIFFEYVDKLMLNGRIKSSK